MKQKIKAVAIDDEPKAIEVIELHAAKIDYLELVKTFRNAPEAVSWINTNEVDLIFLDINMPNLSGLEFRELIGSKPLIIFTTAYSEYALESYEHDAVDYLLKPFTFKRFFKAVVKATEQIQLRARHTREETGNQKLDEGVSRSFILVKSGTKTHKIFTSDILFLEKDGNYVFFQTTENKTISRLSWQQLFELLPGDDFIQVHKSYIVNTNHIEIIENNQLTIAGRKIPVSKKYREELKKILNPS